MSCVARPRFIINLLGLVAAIVIARTVLWPGEGGDEPTQVEASTRLDRALAPERAVEPREGIAAAVMIDVSGSMSDAVDDGGRSVPKIEVARRAAVDLVRQFDQYARAHAGEPVLVGVYEFSERNRQPSSREVIAMSPPDIARAEEAVASMRPSGGTPIGDAMIAGKRALDGTGLSRRHLLVVTDGENTDGYRPSVVMAALGKRPESERPSVYFVAFDIEATRFNTVRDAGALVLAAAGGKELTETLDTLLTGKILVEGTGK